MARHWKVIEKELREQQKIVSKLDQELSKAKKRRKIRCLHCKSLSVVGDTDYIQTHWYERPYG